MPDLTLERDLAGTVGRTVAGLDEVGRGPWAGPVVACAAMLPDIDASSGGLAPDLFAALDDSKKLKAEARRAISHRLKETIAFAIGEASVTEIDDLNILQASLLAMRRAVAALPAQPAGALVDGNRDPGLTVPTRLIVKGDSRSASIAAASILAKVHRDAIMATLSLSYPEFGWDRNMGYGTRAHAEALARLGPTPHHRHSFAPVRARAQEANNI